MGQDCVKFAIAGAKNPTNDERLTLILGHKRYRSTLAIDLVAEFRRESKTSRQ
jgi:septum formation topological specificity factor MinE